MDSCRKQALDAARRALAPRMPHLTAEGIAQGFEGWEVVPVRDPPVGAVFIKGNEIHVAIEPEFHGRWFGKWSFQILRDLLGKYGSVITSVMPGNRAGELFVQRIGFKNKGTFYELRELK